MVQTFKNFYGDCTPFVVASHPWALHSGAWNSGGITGSFCFDRTSCGVLLADGSQLGTYYNVICLNYTFIIIDNVIEV